ncbi:unnamed protein product [Rotaria sordida]|uniref:Uncharacterized protein n=1 Tax=Rotaria sordida TaxID=392033 RepID=A0A818YRX1_9BILA|nr:unnamed protein product [Rotaria sordida]
MSIDEPSSSSSLSISSTDLTTCIKVLSTFTKNNEYLSIESDEYQSIRPIIHNLYHIGRGLKKNKKQNNHRQIKLIDQKTIRLRRAKKFQQFQLEHTIVPDTIEQIETKNEDNDNHIIQQLTELKFCYIFTNGRIKIGYRIVLKLLRANCFVITTSRFSIDFLNRLNKEQDFEQWKDRIHIYEIDFRYSQLVELFTKMLIEKYDRLDFLINNVCQTIQQSKEFYQDLFNHERLINYSLLSNDQQKILNGNLQFYERLIPFSNRIQQTSSSSSSYPLYLPYTNNSNDSSKQTSLIINNTSFDVNQQSIDFRSTNSCLSHLNDLSTIEINEVLTINTLAPFILNSKLKVLMDNKHPNPDSIKFIINVSTMESSFSHSNKTDQHPHTNAAFAALNMMTRTSAIDYLKSNIYMISVDTGLIKDENSSEQVIKSMIDQDFQTPFDEDDAAARVLDPIIDTYKQLSDGKTNINIPYGCFLKDYHICNW